MSWFAAMLQAVDAAPVFDVRGALTQGAVIGGLTLSGALFAGLAAARRSSGGVGTATTALLLLTAAAMETALFGYAPGRSFLVGAFCAAAIAHVGALLGLGREGWTRFAAPALGALLLFGIGFAGPLAPGDSGDLIALIALAGVVPAALVAGALMGRRAARYALPGAILAAAAMPAGFLGAFMGGSGWLALYAPHAAFALGLALVGFVALGGGAAPAEAAPSRASMTPGGDGETLAAVLDYSGFAVWDWRREEGALATDAARRLIAPGVDGPRGADALRSALETDSLAEFDAVTRAGDDGAFDLVLRTRAGKTLRMRGARAADADGDADRVLAIFDELEASAPVARPRPATLERPAPAPAFSPPEEADAPTETTRPAQFRPSRADDDRRQTPRRAADAPTTPAALVALKDRGAFLSAVDDAIAAMPTEDLGGAQRAMFVIDLDRFKSVNDAFGEAGGDALLAEIAERLDASGGPLTVIGRHGGDSFALWALIEAGGPSVAEAAEGLRALISEPFALEGETVHPSASIGVSLDREEEVFAATLLGEAELALADAKRSGGDHVSIFEPQRAEKPAARFGRERDIREGVAGGEFEAHYQPVIRLSDGAAAGFEALVRWRKAGDTLIPPSEFLALAEETGLLEQMERRVLDAACRDLAAWRAETGRTDVFVAVNVSSRRLDRPGDRLAFVRAVKEALAAHDLPRGALRVEVTEDQIMRNPEAVEQALQAIKQLGAGLALDDFGTGHSSLARLRRFDFDVLKIDQAFVKKLDADADSVAIARSIINLAHDLGMTVVAEGAETETTARRLRSMGCEYAQGFIFGAPMDFTDATKFLRLYGVGD